MKKVPLNAGVSDDSNTDDVADGFAFGSPVVVNEKSISSSSKIEQVHLELAKALIDLGNLNYCKNSKRKCREPSVVPASACACAHVVTYSHIYKNYDLVENLWWLSRTYDGKSKCCKCIFHEYYMYYYIMQEIVLVVLVFMLADHAR
jgi:hypothetical protein